MPPSLALPPTGTNLDLFGLPIAAPAATATCADDAGVEEVEEVIEVAAPEATTPDGQLDLFRHSPAEIAANTARRALCEHSVELVQQCIAALRPLAAYAQFVADCDACVELIERRDPRWRDVALAVDWVESELSPAAERCVPGNAARLLRPALLALLETMPSVQDAVGPHRAHPAYLWQLLGEPAQAVAAIEADARWRAHPGALVWHAELCEQAGLNSRALADVVDLCLSWPAQAEQWLGSSPAWAGRWNAWCDLDDALPMHAFPAWARLRCTSELPMPEAGDERPGAALLRLADELAHKPSDLALRKALQRKSPALLSAYLATRGIRDA
jgi:hypothetical protein